MARPQQRVSGSKIFTNAHPAEDAYQLELPGEAGLTPPPRPERNEPSAWIIIGDDIETSETEPPPFMQSVAPLAPQPPPPPAPAPQQAAPAPPPPVPAPEMTPAKSAPVEQPEPQSAPDTNVLSEPPAEPEPPPPPPPPQVVYQGPTFDERLIAEAMTKAASILGEAEAERVQIMEKARAEAGKILEAARQERDQEMAFTKAQNQAILDEARRIRDNAHEEGRAAGFEAGQADAMAAAYAQMEEKVADLVAAITRLTEDALSDRHRQIDAMEPELLDLALEIAEKIITHEVKTQPEQVSAIARACIARVRDRQEIVIHANPADIETLNRYRDQFIRLEDLGALRIIEDSRVGLPGGILIETSSGEIDARVETQLERIRQEFGNVMEADAVHNAWDEQQQ
ncbi:MAG: hypothetical protein FJX76_01840 [Armatimonadetes bacterium]|nr:hypothetical protein [Armatimonadota bacterium]